MVVLSRDNHQALCLQDRDGLKAELTDAQRTGWELHRRRPNLTGAHVGSWTAPYQSPSGLRRPRTVRSPVTGGRPHCRSG